MGMARKCCVKNCGNDGYEARSTGLPLHKFPKDAGLRGRWVASCGFEPSFRPTPGHFVCHRHFKKADYECARGPKVLLKRGSVPSVFADYDNHPDPMTLPIKATSYPQEDLDLINSEISNLDHTDLTLFSDTLTPKSDSYSETCNSRPESSADSFNPVEMINMSENEGKLMPIKDEYIEESQENTESMESKTDHASVESEVFDTEVKMDYDVREPGGIKVKSEQIVDSGELKTEKDECKPKMVNRGGIKFFPGAKLEAKDFNEKWYSARVVETDWVEREVLIHFDKWSSRFDEWIPMDSSRLRVLQVQPREVRMREFEVGERILATWADGRKYPARVNAVLGNDRYDVLFDDGYVKIVRSSKMTKIAATTEKGQNSVSQTDEEYIGSKQERRDRKRKHTVMELFHPNAKKRPRIDSERLIKKEDSLLSEDEVKFDIEESLPGTTYDSGSEMLRGFETIKPKVKSYAKKKKKDPIKHDTDNEEDVGPEWIDGEPQGIESYIVDCNDGPRRSIIVADKRLPFGWQKHFTQRRTGTSAGKWDVLFIHKSSGKKFRSRNDIRSFMELNGQFDFEPEKFDFCIHRKKNNRNNSTKPKLDSPLDMTKKIKTLLPKPKTASTMPETLQNGILTPVYVPPLNTTLTPTDTGAVFIGGLRVEMEDSAYKCPKEGCNKNFRKENLLQMHIKHYHPEYSKFLGSTPNVADLAYARTIGESIEDIIPKKPNNFLEKINKFEKKKAQEKNSVITDPELIKTEKLVGTPNDDSTLDIMSPIQGQNVDMNDGIVMKREASCAMSPGTLFDIKVREDKTQTGIKTLLPVRTGTDSLKLDRSKSLEENGLSDKGKSLKKRSMSEYYSDLPTKFKKKQGMQELTDDYGDLDDSALDMEGPATPTYRFSRRKSDSKSDENSQNSQINDSCLEKGETLKGEAAKRDNSNDAEDGEGVMMMVNGEMVKVEQLRREEIINCTCGFMEEDGLMIQCDLCLCWQHGHCNAIERETDVPEKYVCLICRHPYRQRPSKKYIHDQDWIKEGKLPSLPSRTKNQSAINQRTAILKRSYDLVAALLQIQQILHSLRVKINVAEKKDHPKLYLWAKNWEKTEIPKPNTEPVPIMEIIKPTPECTESILDNTTTVEVKTEIEEHIKEDPDKSTIVTNSELMKILEEDSMHSDEKGHIKKLESQSDGHILLDALTRNSPEKKASEVQNETSEPLNNQPSTSKTPDLVSAISGECMKQEMNPATQPETLLPPQPFIPEPEAPIDPDECRLRLLEHIEHFQNHIDSRLTTIEAQVCVLEAMDPDDPVPSPDLLPRTKQTLQMLLRDLSTVQKLAALC